MNNKTEKTISLKRYNRERQARQDAETLLEEKSIELYNSNQLLQQSVDASNQANLELNKLIIAVEQSPTAIIITDLDGLIQYVNPMFTEITGWEFSEVKGKSTRLLGSGKTPIGQYKKLWETVYNGDIWQGEIYNRKKNGELYLQSATISPIKNDKGELTNFLSNSEDITLRKEYEKRIHHLAHHDSLTGLFNRFTLEERLTQVVALAKRTEKLLAVLFIDLDRFKIINDTLGHKAGDELLIQVSEKIKSICRRDSDIVARIGGDEFVIVLSNIDSPTFALLTATTLVQVLSMPFEFEGNQLLTSPSIGISIYPDDGKDKESLLKNADTAMYHVKESGKANFKFYTKEMNKNMEERLLLEKDLRVALSTNQLELYYQPKIGTSQNQVCGVEALIRWQHPSLGFISPDKFIPIAEESGLISSIGLWVINQACKQLLEWQNKGLTDLKMAINVSPIQLESLDFVAQVYEVLEQYHIQPSQIELEVTESSAMKNPHNAIKQLTAIREKGIELAIDDFGTGHSSLAYLQKLPVQVLKLDRSFVMNIETDKNSATISIATITLAHSLGFKVVAEGVETKAQAVFLKENKCDMLQGYYFSRPGRADEIEAFISQY